MMFGAVSGGHFNPAVTIGVLLREGIPLLKHNAGFALKIIIS